MPFHHKSSNVEVAKSRILEQLILATFNVHFKNIDAPTCEQRKNVDNIDLVPLTLVYRELRRTALVRDPCAGVRCAGGCLVQRDAIGESIPRYIEVELRRVIRVRLKGDHPCRPIGGKKVETGKANIRTQIRYQSNSLWWYPDGRYIIPVNENLICDADIVIPIAFAAGAQLELW